jgi:NADH:ubiquinone oxidoreductase subunit 3 (subunit A)
MIMALFLTLLVGYGIGYIVNESPVAVTRTEKAPICSFDCGFDPRTDYLDKTQHIGFPFIYKDKVIYQSGYAISQANQPKYTKLLQNYIILIIFIEALAGALVVMFKYAHNQD